MFPNWKSPVSSNRRFRLWIFKALGANDWDWIYTLLGADSEALRITILLQEEKHSGICIVLSDIMICESLLVSLFWCLKQSPFTYFGSVHKSFSYFKETLGQTRKGHDKRRLYKTHTALGQQWFLASNDSWPITMKTLLWLQPDCVRSADHMMIRTLSLYAEIAICATPPYFQEPLLISMQVKVH